jgi:predicted ATP-grasp superfamily ATP-dependent carboligase
MTVLGIPRVIVLSTANWFGAPRLTRAFHRAGFDVQTLGYPNVVLTRSRYVSAEFFLSDSAPHEELIRVAREVLIAQRPSFVVPTDDASVELLQALAALARRELPESDPLLVLLRDSLGNFDQHRVLRQRLGLAQVAERAGVRAPAYALVHDRDEAFAFVARHGANVVLKAEETFAGLGVSICNGETELDAALARMAASYPRSLREGAVLQSYVPGRTAMRAVIAHRGRVLAGLSAFKVETYPPVTGPSCVVEFIDHPEMRATASAMIRELDYSGFASLDFIVDAEGNAHLIELNSRPTPICHLGEYLGSDLCLALRHALEGQAVADRDPANLPKKVALFPQEWIRNPSSPHFADAYHDVPWDEPDLLEAYVILARGQMRGGQWRIQADRRERLRRFLVELDARPV